jgi:Ca2+-binding EF-hand superfamily protein
MTTRLVLDELETILREKVRSQMHDVRTKFRHAADSNGQISREALHHLIASIFGTQKQIRPNQIDKLLERINLKHFNKISFDQFINSLFTGEEDLPGWVSRQSTPTNEYLSKRTSSQMFLILKDKVRTK